MPNISIERTDLRGADLFVFAQQNLLSMHHG